MDFYNKHYIRIEDGYVIKGFSDAFEQPLETDICVNEQGERHYNPVLRNGSAPLYKWVDGQMVETTVEEQAAWLEAKKTPGVKISELKAKLASTDYAIIKIAEGAATSVDYAELIAQRQAWRAEINRLEAEIAPVEEPDAPVEKPTTPTEEPEAPTEEPTPPSEGGLPNE